MAELKKIERIRGGDAVAVRFEGGYFELPADMAAEKGLREGMDLDLLTLEELRAEGARRLAVLRAARLASARPMSKKELKDKLVRRGESREDALAAVERLEELGALNEEDYARNVVRIYASKGYGRGRVQQELRGRGVPRDLWDDALADMPDPQEAIERYLARHLHNPSDEKEVKRAADALYRRGFNWEDIRAQIRRVTNGILEED